MTRRTVALAAVLALAACQPHRPPAPDPPPAPSATSSAPATGSPTPTPTPAPAVGIRQVHSPGHVTDDMHLAARQCHGTGTTPADNLPDPACTPGAIDPALTRDVLCAPGWSTRTVRPPETETAPVKRQLMAAYGATGSGAGWELDHKIPLELGGANSTSNLWPEIGGSPNVKDRRENDTRAAVCAGRISLADAQRMFATDWRTAP